MQQTTAIVLAALILSAAILVCGGWLRESSRYTIGGTSADGLTAWRIDHRTGEMAMCGAKIPGQALSYAADMDVAAITAQTTHGAKADRAPWLDFTAVLQRATPRCSPWSSTPGE